MSVRYRNNLDYTYSSTICLPRTCRHCYENQSVFQDLTYQVAALTDTQDRQDILEDQPARQKDQPANEVGSGF